MANYDLLNQETDDVFVPTPLLVSDMKVCDLKELIIECLKEMRGSCPAAINPENVQDRGNKQLKGDEIGY